MIRMDGVRRRYKTLHGHVDVLRGVDFEIGRGEKVGVLGKNGAGKSTLVRLISGAEQPNAGTIHRSMSVSWPLAFAGGFQGTLTGLDNLRFICRIYNQDWRTHLDFIEDFTELGRFLREPLSTYSSGMRSRLAFALSMVVDFDCFLIDEIMAVGDHRFHERCHEELFEKRGHKAMIFVSHDPGFLRAWCQRASVLKDGVLHNFDDLEHGFHYYYRDELPATMAAAQGELQPVETEPQTIDQLLFGRDVPELREHFGEALAQRVFSHPLNAEPEVAHYRLNQTMTEQGVALARSAFAQPLESDYSWRSVHSALAAYAEQRPDCPAAREFCATFEAPLAVEGPDGLWVKMASEGGSIRRITTFVHKPTGETLPLRVDFVRPSTDDHVRNELAEFKMSPEGVTCILQICHPDIYAIRLFCAFPYLLRYFETAEMHGEFALSLGDEGLNERVLSFCSQSPEYLIVDSMFIGAAGYAAERTAYGFAKPWAERIDKAYWRGTDTGAFRYFQFTDSPRVAIAHLSREHSELIDAKITQVELRPGWEHKHAYFVDNGLIGDPEPQNRILDFKYQIDVDGNTNSWPGLFLKLLSGSPVLKVQSELGYRQWYYDQLVPWVNYVPVAADAHDLLDRLKWLQDNPAEAEAIGARGRELALSITYDRAVDHAVATITKLVTINRRARIR